MPFFVLGTRRCFLQPTSDMSEEDDEINYPTGFGLKDIVSWGSSGMICLDAPTQTIVKSPHRDENKDDIAIEQRIYERSSERGSHEGLLQYHGPYESGIRPEFAPNGNLRTFLGKRGREIDMEKRLRWAKQITDTLRFIHSMHVIHRDVTCGNILLDADLNARLSDFGWSSLDGSPLLVAVTASHHSPGAAQSIQGDIFSLGSTFYELITGYFPFAELPEEEITARYSRAQFPETKSLGMIGDIITGCWPNRYSSFDAIFKDLEALHMPIHIVNLQLIVTSSKASTSWSPNLQPPQQPPSSPRFSSLSRLLESLQSCLVQDLSFYSPDQ